MSSSCEARARRALASVLSESRNPQRVSVLIEQSRAALRASLEHACVLERRAALRAAANASDRVPYDAYISSLAAVDEACTRLFALEGQLMRARVLAQEADVKAIREAILVERTRKGKKYHSSSSQSTALAQRLMDAVPLPPDAHQLQLTR